MDEAAALFTCVRSIPNARGIEIGRYNGGSTLMLAVAVGDNGKVISIDIDPRLDDQLIKVLNQEGIADRVDLIIGDCNRVEIEGSFDFVFIDGDHSLKQAKLDHLKWGAKVRIDGYIIHHDMANTRQYTGNVPHLKELRDDILSYQRKDIKLINEVGSIAIFQRISDTWTSF